MLVLTIWFGAQTIGGFTLSVAMPTYLVREVGLSPGEATRRGSLRRGFALLGGYLIDRFPLRAMALVVMAGVAVTAVPGFLIIAAYGTVTAAVAGQVLCSVFLGPAYSVGAVLAMTLFPTGIRFTAFAVPLSIATALFGTTAPFVSTWLVAVTDSPLAPGFYLFAAATAGTVAAAVGLAATGPGQTPRPGPAS